MSYNDDLLERLAPTLSWEADWQDVISRAERHRTVVSEASRLPRRRRVLIVAVAVAAVILPLTALAAAKNWWFLAAGPAPKATSAPVLVKQGDWDGKRWQLVAYPSTTDGVCWAIVPGDSTTASPGYTQGCASIVGVPRTPEKQASPDMTISYLSASASTLLPAYIAGPVVGDATEVEVRFRNGETLRTPTFPAPTPLDHVRFYAARRPAATMNGPPGPGRSPKWIAGLDARGNVVACLASLNGVPSPTAACR